MIHEKIAVASTVEEATKIAKEQLNAPAVAEVKIEVLELPKKKTLGLFGGAPAKVKAWYEAPEVKEEKKPESKKAPGTVKPRKAPKTENEAPAPKAEKQEPAAEEKKEAQKTPVDIAAHESLTKAKDYLTKVITGMGVAQVSVEALRTEEDEIILELDCGEDYGIVIGRRGETLDSIQYLTRLVANKYKKENEYSRISVNVGSYREKRRTTLEELARKNSQKVLKYGRNVTFEPMNPYERRIIHTAVQEIEGVTSYSVGSDSSRRVVISLKEGVKPTHPSKGGYNRRGGRGYNNNRRDKRRDDRQVKTDAPQRAPRTDAGAEKVSLYGKIN